MMTDVAASDEAARIVTNLFERHNAEIFAYLYRMIGDREGAQDLAQETFLQAFRARQDLPQVHNQRAWLYRVATNLALNAIKRRNRFRWLPWLNTYRPAADAGAKAGERSAIEAALSSLAPHYRAPLLLYSHYGLNLAEVAEALSISQGAVKTRLYRAREMFRQAYERGNAQ